MGSVKAQLDLAKSIYERQKNLWDQHIGTEVQLLQDKTNVESLGEPVKSNTGKREYCPGTGKSKQCVQ